MSLKRQFFWSMVPLLAVTLVNLFSVPLFLRFLGQDLYALWFYVNTLSGTFGFMDMGLGAAVGRYIGVALGAQDPAAVRRYWGTGNLMALPVLTLMMTVFIAIGAFFGPHWFRVSPENARLLQWAFVAGGVSLFVNYYTNFWLVLSQAHFDFRFTGLLRSVLSVLQVLTSIWLAWLTRNPVVLILNGLFFSVVQLGFFVWHARRSYQLGFNLRDATMACAREMFHFGSKVFGTVLVSAFGSSTDRLFLGRLAPPAVFADYTVGYNFGQRIQGLSFTIMGPVFHQTSRALGKSGREATAAIYNETFDFTFGWYALMGIWTACWHPVFLRLWLRNAELASQVAPAFTPLVIAFCLSGIASISTAQLAPLNRVGVELGFNIVNSICLGAFAVAGWYWDGLAGVGWGVLASRMVVVAQDLYVIRMVKGGGWLAWHTWRHLLAQCIVGGAFYGLGLFLPRPSNWEIVPALLHGTLVAAWLSRRYVGKFILGTRRAVIGQEK